MTPWLDNTVIPKNTSDNNIHFIRVPLCKQETEYTCGIACLQSILGCFGMDYRQDILAKKLQSKPIYGTDYRKIISFAQQLGFQAYFIEGMSIHKLKQFINEGITPLLLIEAWADAGVDYTSDWSDGHYVITCGYDTNRIYFMDPWTLGHYTYIPIDELKMRWHSIDKFGRKYYQSGLIIKKDHCKISYDPHKVKYLG